MSLLLQPVKKTFRYGDHNVTLETGRIARQATASVLVDMDGTVVLVALVAEKEAKAGRDFFPLTVHYLERFYAGGRIPGGFFKREGRPTEQEVLTSRLIDRPLRPLFEDGFMNEVQIVATVLSINPEVDPDIAALLGASAAVAVAGLPFKGPVGAARVGYKNGSYLLNPTRSQLEQSDLDLVVAGTASSVLMVESEAKQLTEETMLGAVMYGHEQMQIAIKAINELKEMAAAKPFAWTKAAVNTDLVNAVSTLINDELGQAYRLVEKQARQAAVKVARDKVIAALAGEEEGKFSQSAVENTFHELESKIVRQRILKGERRIDGRDLVTVRQIDIQTGVLPRTHGSALFTRGETQALVVVTLGATRDGQIIDSPLGERRENFMLHYNFPPYCVGELGMVGSPKRREIGHGRLAKRSIQAVVPDATAFPYVLRVVSEITESNGSSSMASVCGTSLAMMDAGVPTSAPVAGIAMGLIKEGNDFAVLTDILGDEDHLGDMDFKVAGTANAVTALQMDIKIDGITPEIMKQALEQAKAGRLHILGLMNEAIAKPRGEMSDYAPRIISFKIHPDKIRDVIGKGGVTIRQLTEETKANIELDDDGTVRVIAVDRAAGELARARIEALTMDIEVGKIYVGKVVRIVDFGAFVSLMPGKDGLVHISQICNERVENVNDKLTMGQEVTVKVLEIDRQGKIRLSMKEVEPQMA